MSETEKGLAETISLLVYGKLWLVNVNNNQEVIWTVGTANMNFRKCFLSKQLLVGHAVYSQILQVVRNSWGQDDFYVLTENTITSQYPWGKSSLAPVIVGLDRLHSWQSDLLKSSRKKNLL